jgi:hypothetical protein
VAPEASVLLTGRPGASYVILETWLRASVVVRVCPASSRVKEVTRLSSSLIDERRPKASTTMVRVFPALSVVDVTWPAAS